jgi:ribonucleoside-diphosphate reductase alpha subunit
MDSIIEKTKVVISVSREYIENFVGQYMSDIDRTCVNIDETISDIAIRLPQTMLYIEFMNFVSDYYIAKSSFHPEYGKLASKIVVSKMHYLTFDNIVDSSDILYNHCDSEGKHNPIISQTLFNIIKQHGDKINAMIDYTRDYDMDYFGMKTMERSYLLKIHLGKNVYIIERPQQLFMRVSIGLHKDDLDAVLETYNVISKKYYTHATPTLFNIGTNREQCSSCFLLGVDDDMESILNQIKQMGMISKWAGGIGIHLSSVRGKGALIRGTNGISEGILPLCNVINKLTRYINQGGKRGGAIAVYLEPWHPDIFEFCELRKASTGNDDNRTRDLFLALWIPDLFMKRVENDEMWSLMDPDICVNLNKTHSEQFEELYIKYENECKYKKQVRARALWQHIIECQMETGLPYITYKDNANRKSNQQNLGTICSSNLCSEIIEYSDCNETAVCNLCSICLPRFVNNNNGTITYDYNLLQYVTRLAIRNLNKIIDLNYYPSDNAKRSNMRHRPVGLGIQGISDVYNLFECPFESDLAQELNKRIFETIYYAAVDESMKLAKRYGHYETFINSPFSKGQLQYHLWGMKNTDLITYGEYDWDTLVNDVKTYGTRNSLLTALMPTAGTAQIMKCSECFEPIMSNIFVRTTLAGEFIVVNENLVKMLSKYNLWDENMRKLIILNNGSIQNIDTIPVHIKDIFKTAFEIKLKSIISQSADRGPFIDQSQSMNLFMKTPDPKILTSSHFYGWKRGLKTGMYYLRTTPAVNPLQFGIDIDDAKKLLTKPVPADDIVCKREKGCTVCGS